MLESLTTRIYHLTTMPMNSTSTQFQTTMPLNLYRLQVISLQHIHKQTTLVHKILFLLTHLKERTAHNLCHHNPRHILPTPSQTSDDNIGYVEQLLTYKYINGKKYFQLKWIGHSERTWEPEDNINPTLIQEFHINRTQKGKAHKRKKRSCFN